MFFNTSSIKIQPEAIRAFDQDLGINAPIEYSINHSTEAQYFAINSSTGVVRLLNSLELSHLFQLHSVTLVVKATQLDNGDRYALTTLIISTRKGPEMQQSSNSIQEPFSFLQNKFSAKVREDLLVNSRILALPLSKRPGEHVRYTILDSEQAQFFSIGDLGELILQKPLDYERKVAHKFTVFATDGKFNATTEVGKLTT